MTVRRGECHLSSPRARAIVARLRLDGTPFQPRHLGTTERGKNYEGTRTRPWAWTRSGLGHRGGRAGGHGVHQRRAGTGFAERPATRARTTLPEAHRVRPARPGARAPGGAPGDRRRERRQPLLRPAGLRRLGRLRGRQAPGRRLRPAVQPFDYLAFEVVGPSALQQIAPTPITYVEGVDFGVDHPDRPRRRHRERHGRSTCSSASATPRPAAARRPTAPASRPGTSRCSSAALHVRDQGRERRGRTAPSAS